MERISPTESMSALYSWRSNFLLVLQPFKIRLFCFWLYWNMVKLCDQGFKCCLCMYSNWKMTIWQFLMYRRTRHFFMRQTIQMQCFILCLSWLLDSQWDVLLYVLSKHLKSSLEPCRFVFFLDPCNIDIVQRRIKSVALCVSSCPQEELKTLEDIRKFAITNGEEMTKPSVVFLFARLFGKW